MHSSDIVGYTFTADTYCPGCICEEVLSSYYGGDAGNVKSADAMNERTHWLKGSEWNLRRMAPVLDINPDREDTYDGDDFPKIMTADMCDGSEVCDKCGDELVED